MSKRAFAWTPTDKVACKKGSNDTVQKDEGSRQVDKKRYSPGALMEERNNMEEINYQRIKIECSWPVMEGAHTGRI